MIIWLIGSAIWVLAFSALFFSRKALPSLTDFRWLMPTLIILACVLYLRPHQDIWGGQDPGVYLNNAMTYINKGKLFHSDPLLAKVSDEAKPEFIRGYKSKKPLTPGKCLSVVDADKALLGPWFQPLHSITAGVFGGLLGPRATLYVTPIFALMSAWMLALLGAQIFSNRFAAPILFLCFILNPINLWHARCSRAEYTALFFLLSSLYFFIRAYRSTTPLRPVLICALCGAIAPFFHITAWIFVIQLTLAALWAGKSKQRTFLLIPLFTLAGVLGLYLQSAYITDCYKILASLQKLWGNPMTWISLIAAGLLLFFTPIPSWAKTNVTASLAPIAGIGIALIILQSISPAAGGRIFSNPLTGHLQLSDIAVLIEHISLPVAFISLAGLCCCLFKRPRRTALLFLCIMLIPGTLLMGNMPISMYFLRRSILFFIPLLSIGATALILTVFALKIRWAKSAALLLLLVTLGSGLYARTHFLLVTDHRGYVSYLQPYLDELKKNDGLLLCEYDRLAATFAHFFNIPTLALGPEKKCDREVVFTAWATIMEDDPKQSFYFLTPFDTTPSAERFTCELVVDSHYEKTVLDERKGKMATSTKTSPLDLRLYKISLKPQGPASVQEP